MLNDGTKTYDNNKDGAGQEAGRCSVSPNTLVLRRVSPGLHRLAMLDRLPPNRSDCQGQVDILQRQLPAGETSLHRIQSSNAADEYASFEASNTASRVGQVGDMLHDTESDAAWRSVFGLLRAHRRCL